MQQIGYLSCIETFKLLNGLISIKHSVIIKEMDHTTVLLICIVSVNLTVNKTLIL